MRAGRAQLVRIRKRAQAYDPRHQLDVEWGLWASAPEAVAWTVLAVVAGWLLAMFQTAQW